MTPSTFSNNSYTIESSNSGGIIGSESLLKNGGTFRFYLSYISKITGQESDVSKEFIVNVPPSKDYK